MSDEQLTPEETQKLFREASKAIHETDSVKLAELMEQKPSSDEPVVAEEIKTEDPPAETPPEEKAKEEITDLSEKTDEHAEVVDEVKPELTELEKLKLELEKVSKENHSLKSQAGRVPHVQRKLQELDKKLEELAKQKDSPSSHPSSKIQPKVNELLKGLKETDPELADTIAAAMAEVTNGVSAEMQAKEESTLTLLRQQEYQSYQEQEIDKLLTMVPNAIEVFKDPYWNEWKEKQTPRILQLANSDTADDVAFAFKKYADDMRAAYPALNAASVTNPEPAAVTTSEQAEKAKQIEKERERKKATSVTVTNPAVAPKSDAILDGDALFRKYSEDIRKQNGR